MTEHETPKRWREDGGPALLLSASLEQQGLGPSDDMLAAMLSQVQAAVAAGTATPSFDAGSGAQAASQTALPGTMGLTAKIGAAVLVVMASVGAWVLCQPPATSEQRAEITAHLTLPRTLPSVAAPLEAAPIAHGAAPASAALVRPKKRKTVAIQMLPSDAPIPEAETGNLAEELTLLRKARRALAQNPEQTLLFIAEHEAGFSRGSFVEERELLAIEALIALDRRDTAEQRAKKYKKAFPDSLHLRRLEVVLGAKAQPATGAP